MEHYTQRGQTSRGSHTPGHLDCPECGRAGAVYEPEVAVSMTFTEAFAKWIGEKDIGGGEGWRGARHLSPRTVRDLRQYARAAEKFFGALRLEQIHAGHLREYQRARATCDRSCGGWEAPAGANLIRKETGTVIRVMKAAGAWTAHHEKFFAALPGTESDVPRALSPEEQDRWLRAAASRAEWRLVYLWSVLALQTAAATNELRALRLGDCYLEQGVVQVRSEGAKNRHRVRTVPIATEHADWALRELMRRAALLGATRPFEYLFPLHLTGNRYDPMRAMTVWGMRKPWDGVRAAAGIAWFTPYGLRHTGATRMAESGMPIQVLMSLMGHVSQRMQQHYVTISMQAKRRWAQMAWSEPPRYGPETERGLFSTERRWA